MWEQIAQCTALLETLKKPENGTPEARLEVLAAHSTSKSFFGSPALSTQFREVIQQPVFAKNVERMIAIHAVVCCHQGPVVFRTTPNLEKSRLSTSLLTLTDELVMVERVYSGMGGIVGYHVKILELIVEAEAAASGQPFKSPTGKDKGPPCEYLEPAGTDISDNASPSTIHDLVYAGIENLPQMAELYPVGGAGDRLHLIEEGTGKFLPAAQLQFLGRTLLEGLVRDLQAREYLHYKVFGVQLTTPIGMMTSHEKDNNKYIRAICETNKWFGRPKESIMLFTQPLVPVVNKLGQWSMKDTLTLYTKPGGHGMLWKLAYEAGVFNMYKNASRKKILVRQINNPAAGQDYALLAYCGLGVRTDSLFGFASCPRRVGAAEGILVVKYSRGEDTTHQYVTTNVEYTELKKLGIPDVPAKPGSQYSKYPSNPNILFADINKIEELARTTSLPGLIVNLKSTAPYIAPDGTRSDIHAGRLESSMQNIADNIVDVQDNSLSQADLSNLTSMVTYNTREKTISVSKNSYVSGKSLLDTPEGCYYELLQNYYVLLTKHCNMSVGPLGTRDDYIAGCGPSFLLYFHPALGPSYHIIAQKLRGGIIHPGSELNLEVVTADILNLNLKGSMCIKATSPLGSFNEDRTKLEYNNENGKATLRNVTVVNKGVDYSYPQLTDNQFWKGQFVRKERFSVTLHGSAELIAEDCCIRGSFDLEVPTGTRATLYNDKSGSLCARMEDLVRPSWEWRYHAKGNDRAIQLDRKEDNGAVARRKGTLLACLCAAD